jgi:hypothetical protein
MDGSYPEHARVVDGLQARTRLGESEGLGHGRLSVAEFPRAVVRLADTQKRDAEG